MCCLQRNKIPVWTQKEGLGVEWVAPSFVSYASSCLFTSIQCPVDPQDNHPMAFSVWPRRQIWEMCFLEQQMSLCWCHHRRVVWVDLLLSCVSLVEFCELENLRLWSSLCPRQLHLWTSQWCHWKTGVICTERNVQYFAVILHILYY